mmetsp:Transcript_29530/g.78154  ORF Transcript_29530/g.78154 Transcript_29530/m.78154 type:complete len:314 (-) Transcript_29530:59-1000(-)
MWLRKAVDLAEKAVAVGDAEQLRMLCASVGEAAQILADLRAERHATVATGPRRGFEDRWRPPEWGAAAGRAGAEGAFVPLRGERQQNLIILDWDDTLLCTSFLRHYHGQSLSPDLERRVRTAADSARELVQLALRCGRTIIVTNAESGWVEASAAVYSPALLPVLQRVSVVSAQSKYASRFPGDTCAWKVEAFRELQETLDPGIRTNMVTIGDSEAEMEAAVAMQRKSSDMLIKLVKCLKEPSPEQLRVQLDFLVQNLAAIVANPRAVHLKMGRDTADSLEVQVFGDNLETSPSAAGGGRGHPAAARLPGLVC